MSEATQLLNAIEAGDPHASAQLLPLVYDELRDWLPSARPGEAGADAGTDRLGYEAYLRLVGDGQGQHWDHRGHFFAAAAEAMRRILVETARRKQGPKHGGRLRRIDADLNLVAAHAPLVDLLALDEALTKLAKESPARAELVKLRLRGADGVGSRRGPRHLPGHGRAILDLCPHLALRRVERRGGLAALPLTSPAREAKSGKKIETHEGFRGESSHYGVTPKFRGANA